MCFTSFRFYLFYVCTAPLSTCKGRLIKFATMMMTLYSLPVPVQYLFTVQAAPSLTTFCRQL